MLNGLLGRVQSVQRFLFSVSLDIGKSDLDLKHVHDEVVKECYVNGNTLAKVLRDLRRRIYGPITGLNKLAEDSRAQGLCFWHGELKEVENGKDRDVTLWRSMCPQCEQCPV